MGLRKWRMYAPGLLAVVLLFAATACEPTQVNVSALSTAADGLDLQAVGELLKGVENAEQFETKLNDPGEGVNNLDLDEDGTTDFIKVTEYGEGAATGFSLTVDMGGGEEQEVATVGLAKVGEEVDVELHGNDQIYGSNYYYQDRYRASNYLLFAYMFRPHPLYFSPYSYGFYPGFYRPYPVVGMSSYRSRTSTVTSRSTSKVSGTSSSAQSKVGASPNAGKASGTVKAPLKSPTASQKSFQSRNPSKQVRGGGFGTSRTSVRGTGSSSRGGK